MKLARSAASRSLSGFAGSVRAAPGARASRRGSGETSVVSVSEGADAPGMTVTSDTSVVVEAVGTATGSPGASALGVDKACRSIKRR